MDSGDNTRGNYNSTKIKARLEGREDAARFAGMFFTGLGILGVATGLASTGLDDFGRLCLFNAGLACFGWAGIMVIGWGATSGHLAVFRLVEHSTHEGIEKMDTAIELEKRTGRIVGDVLEDDLRRKRNGGYS